MIEGEVLLTKLGMEEGENRGAAAARKLEVITRGMQSGAAMTDSTCTPTAGNLDRHKQAGKASKLPGPGTEVACLTTRSARVR